MDIFAVRRAQFQSTHPLIRRERRDVVLRGKRYRIRSGGTWGKDAEREQVSDLLIRILESIGWQVKVSVRAGRAA